LEGSGDTDLRDIGIQCGKNGDTSIICDVFLQVFNKFCSGVDTANSKSGPFIMIGSDEEGDFDEFASLELDRWRFGDEVSINDWKGGLYILSRW
jgi:hypothetical protein